MIKLNAVHKKRLTILLVVSIVAASISGLVLYGLKNSINLYVTPDELLRDVTIQSRHVHVGGMVEEKSVVKSKENLHVTFRVTDFKRSIPVEYDGILPDLFREGKGVVMQGRLDEKGVFRAQTILAKHDENYVPVPIKKR